MRSNSAGATPLSGARRLTASSPVVSVPVLSKMKALILAAASVSATFLIRVPGGAGGGEGRDYGGGGGEDEGAGAAKDDNGNDVIEVFGESPNERGDDENQGRIEA